jgi:hypothetical protein
MEAKIVCNSVSYALPDLNLNLVQGDEVWVSVDAAHRSKDLARARSVGAVAVTYGRRCLVSRLPPPPAYTQGRKQRAETRPMPPGEPAPAPSLDTKALTEAIAAGVASGIADLLARGILVPAGQQPPQPRYADPLPEYTRAAEPSRTRTAEPSLRMADPVFIPSNLVPADTTSTINVTSTSEDVGGLDEAAAALAALRKKRKE